MTIYNYDSINEHGHHTKGVLEGESPQQIRQQLRKMGLIPLAISQEEQKSSSHFRRFISPKKGVNNATLSLFTYQLGTLLSAGLTLEAALLNISEQMENTPLESVLLKVRSRIIEGHPLAYGLDEYPYIFPALYRATIQAGDKSGKLDKVVSRLANYLESQENIRQKIQQALIYPSLLTLVSIGIIGFLLSYAMPKITEVFVQTGQPLPDITKALLFLSHLLQHYGMIFLGLLVVSFFVMKRLLKRSYFLYQLHYFLLKIPLLNNTIIIINAARFSRTFGILFDAGVPIMDAMAAANSIVTLLPMRDAIKLSILRISEGLSIHQALAKTGFFTKLSTQLIASGEASGQLEIMLEKSAIYQEQNMIRWMATALSLFEPVMIIVMGLVVLFIVLAILLPIFEMNQFVS